MGDVDVEVQGEERVYLGDGEDQKNWEEAKGERLPEALLAFSRELLLIL